MNSPPVTFRQCRHAKVRVALAQELLAFFRPAGLRDVMEDGVHLKGNVFFGVHVRMLDEQLVLDDCLCLLATSCLWHLSFGSGTVVGDFDQRVVVVHGRLKLLRESPRMPAAAGGHPGCWGMVPSAALGASDELVGEVGDALTEGLVVDEAHRFRVARLAEETLTSP